VTDGGIAVAVATVGIKRRIPFEYKEEARQRTRAPLNWSPGTRRRVPHGLGFICLSH